MSMGHFDFFDSPYFVPEPGNWHLKPDAPEEIKKAFEEFERAFELSHSHAPTPEEK